MNYKSLMIDSLTELLKDGETLKYPIYGTLEQGGETYYGYFGLTENHLLIALMFGKQITNTIRIPLDIKSVKIKKTLIFKQYLIDISFNDGAPCRLRISPRVFMIDSQKGNLPNFVKFLSQKATWNYTPKLKDIDGLKIRWQYFNAFIYMVLSALPMPLIIITVQGLKNGSFIFSEFIATILTGIFTFAVLFAPVIFLSVLNRFLFGKVVCVIGNYGIHLENDFLRWDEIKEITYIPDINQRFSLRYSRACVTLKRNSGKEFDIEINHFPLYGLRKIKKICPEVKIELAKSGWCLILFVALIPTVISLIISLLI